MERNKRWCAAVNTDIMTDPCRWREYKEKEPSLFSIKEDDIEDVMRIRAPSGASRSSKASSTSLKTVKKFDPEAEDRRRRNQEWREKRDRPSHGCEKQGGLRACLAEEVVCGVCEVRVVHGVAAVVSQESLYTYEKVLVYQCEERHSLCSQCWDQALQIEKVTMQQ